MSRILKKKLLNVLSVEGVSSPRKPFVLPCKSPGPEYPKIHGGGGRIMQKNPKIRRFLEKMYLS